MIYRFIVFFRAHKDFSVNALILGFISLVLITLLGTNHLSETNLGVIYILFGPLVSIGVFARIFSLDYQHNFAEIITTYNESKSKIFLIRYTLALFLFLLPLACGFFFFLLHPGHEEYNIWPQLGATLSAAWVLGSLSMLLAIGAKRYDVGLLGGFIVFLVVIRIPLSNMIYNLFFPIAAVVFGIVTYCLFRARR